MATYDGVIDLSWVVFLLVWGISSFGVKRDLRGGGLAGALSRSWGLQLAAVLATAVVAVRLAQRGFVGSVFASARTVFTPPPALGWLAAALSVIGIGVAIWARAYLGRNWSPRPAVKEHHELVTAGPYAYVRHPIYSGVILAALGTALTGTVFGLSVCVLACVILLSRIGKEERLMRQLFPDDYPAYQARTKRLVPFVW